MAYSSNNNSKKKALLTAVIVVAAIVFVVVLWRVIWGGAPAPHKALQELATAQRYHASAELILNLPLRVQGRERPFPNLLTRVEGDVVRNEHGTPELAGELYMEATGRGEQFTAEGDVRILNDATLFYLDSLPVLLNPSGSLTKKWTGVPTALLHTYNGDTLHGTIFDIFATLQSEGTTTFNDQQVRRYVGTLTPEQETQLISVLRYDASHNHGLNSLARLLQTSDVKSLTVDINDEGEFAQILLVFVQELPDGREVDRAGVRLSFTEYGKEVTIDRPESRLTVRPEVFARMFGTGEIVPQ